MGTDYINKLLEIFPNIASGRKNFRYFENRIKKNIYITKKYNKKKKDKSFK